MHNYKLIRALLNGRFDLCAKLDRPEVSDEIKRQAAQQMRDARLKKSSTGTLQKDSINKELTMYPMHVEAENQTLEATPATTKASDATRKKRKRNPKTTSTSVAPPTESTASTSNLLDQQQNQPNSAGGTMPVGHEHSAAASHSGQERMRYTGPNVHPGPVYLERKCIFHCFLQF